MRLRPVVAEHTNARPQLLFLCQTLPFPPDGGVNIRTYNIMRLLARTFDVTALCFYRKGSRPSDASVRASVAGLSNVAQVEAFPIPQEQSRTRLMVDHLRSVVSSKAYTYFAYSSKSFEGRLRELLATRKFDLVHVDSMDLSVYLPLLKGLPVACTHHNVESSLLKSRANAESGLRKLYMHHQSKLTEKEERAWCEHISINVAVSPDDAAGLKRLAPGARVVVIPNGVDTDFFQPRSGKDRGLVFVGGYGWFPNRDAMEFFSADILPLLCAEDRRHVTWVGRCPDSARELYQRDFGMHATGYVDDVRPYIQDAAVYVAPLRAGGGTRLKILDAWAMGKAVVSTTVGCEGLAAEDGKNILIRDDARSFANAIHTLLDDRGLRTRLGLGARETALRIYNWEVIGKSLINEYMQVLAHGARRRTV